MKRTIQKQLAQACATGTVEEIREALEPFFADSKGWVAGADQFEEFLSDGAPRFSVIQKQGNKKLPFAKFSTLPVFTCPGRGDCENWCYSFSAWRFVNPFFIQCQNTILLRFNRQPIVDALNELEDGSEFRLYVDGDFDSIETLRFWMREIENRPGINVYGYSKSWELFLAFSDLGNKFPENYTLNLSNGSRYNEAYRMRMESLSCVRGSFEAFEIPKESKAPIGARTNAYRKAVREAAGKRVFVCPGLCGSCTPKGHACGSRDFDGIPIAIGID